MKETVTSTLELKVN
jgi:enoyl-CoA hydratase